MLCHWTSFTRHFCSFFWWYFKVKIALFYRNWEKIIFKWLSIMINKKCGSNINEYKGKDHLNKTSCFTLLSIMLIRRASFSMWRRDSKVVILSITTTHIPSISEQNLPDRFMLCTFKEYKFQYVLLQVANQYIYACIKFSLIWCVKIVEWVTVTYDVQLQTPSVQADILFAVQTFPKSSEPGCTEAITCLMTGGNSS